MEKIRFNLENEEKKDRPPEIDELPAILPVVPSEQPKDPAVDSTINPGEIDDLGYVPEVIKNSKRPPIIEA